MKVLLLLLFTSALQVLFAQRSTYNNCSGAVFAPIEGSFSLSYLGEKKDNQIWLVFIAPKSGKFQLDVTSISASLNYTKGVLYISNEAWCGLTPLQKSQTDSISFEIRGQPVVKEIDIEKILSIKNQTISETNKSNKTAEDFVLKNIKNN